MRDTLQTQNLDLKRLLEKAAVNSAERDIAERIQSVLTEELHHRMKNMLAMVTAIVRQSLRSAGNVQDAERAIAARLIAMASAHDLLLRADWKTVGLTAMVRGAIEQHNTSFDRIVVEGEEIDILSSAVVPLTLLLNELCTNATKYGALSADGGQVALNWSRGDAGKSVTFRWAERGGPLVGAPGKQSFGMRLMEKGLPQQLGGTGRLSFHPAGVEFELVVPASNLVAPAVG